MFMKKNYAGRNFTAIFTAFLIILGVGSFLNAYGTPIVVDPTEGIDVILVIDTSGSMRTTDPERIALEAASLFMDMMETRHSRIGIIAFSGDLHSVVPLSPLHEVATRRSIRSNVADFVYHGWTDIGMALRTAAEMLLESPEDNNSPMILLFTDGRIELAEWSERTMEDSYNDAWWAVTQMEDIAPIYTIGLNYDGSVNTGFLQEISRRTEGDSFFIEDAALLPELFHEIFASHIRSSINEVSTFFTDGDSFTDVIIPIPSHFVAEANIIMLSSRPLTDVRLFDPVGREVFFDDGAYTLTAANRYSMIKILEPEMGDWLMRVRGLPDDRVTVSLIYNYSVDVAFSITQPDMTGAFFDPTEPVLVQAGFITPMPPAQVQNLFTDSVAEVHVFDLDMNPLEIIPMTYSGTAFVAELMPSPPQNVRIHINVTHPGFTSTTTTVTITYDGDLLASGAEPTAPEVEALPPTEPETEAATEPVTEPEPTERSFMWLLILLLVLIVIAIGALLFFLIKKQGKRNIFMGHLEVRSLLPTGKYTALEAPSLSTFAGKISLSEFLKVSLGSKANRILNVNVPIQGTYIEPATLGNRPMLHVTTDGSCVITDQDKNTVSQKKFLWENNSRLTFSIPGKIEKIEITYRVDAD